MSTLHNKIKGEIYKKKTKKQKKKKHDRYFFNYTILKGDRENKIPKNVRVRFVPFNLNFYTRSEANY